VSDLAFKEGGPPARSPVEAAVRRALRSRVVRYYEENQFFYDRFWTESSTRSMNYGYWDADTRRLSQAFRNQNQAIAEHLRVDASDRVLEAGCGTGGATVWLARHHGCRGVGITLCPHQARRGGRIAAEQGVAGRTAFLVMDYTEMGFPDASFTKLFASESVCYASRKSEFLREAHRVLRPGGRLVVVDGFRADRPLGERERWLLESWAEGWAVPGLARVDEFASDLQEVGFREVSFRDQTARAVPSARRILARGLLAWPLARAAHAAGVLSGCQLAHVRSSIHQYTIWRDRIALHGIFSARR